MIDVRRPCRSRVTSPLTERAGFGVSDSHAATLSCCCVRSSCEQQWNGIDGRTLASRPPPPRRRTGQDRRRRTLSLSHTSRYSQSCHVNTVWLHVCPTCLCVFWPVFPSACEAEASPCTRWLLRVVEKPPLMLWRISSVAQFTHQRYCDE